MQAGVPTVVSLTTSGIISTTQLWITFNTQVTAEIDRVYLGTGAYLSKPVDRAGVPWTNYGALPVPGPFGTGLQFSGNSYLQAPGPMIGTTGTVAMVIRADSITTNQLPFFNRGSTDGMAMFIAATTGGSSVNIRKADGSLQTVNTGTFTVGTLYFIVITYTATQLKAYRDGALLATTNLTEPPRLSTTPLTVGGVSSIPDQFFRGFISIRADSRVWTDDEIARWSRDPYSEDSGLVDAFSLDFTNLPTFADNAAAIAGNLPAGKLYKTSTGNVLVRY